MCGETGHFIEARIYDSPTSPIAGPFPVNVHTANSVLGPSVAPDPGGGLLISWNGVDPLGSDLSGSGIRARRVGWDGVAASEQHRELGIVIL